MSTGPVVVDASVVLRWVLGGGTLDEIDRAAAFLEQYHGALVAPSLFVTEVLGRISGLTKVSGPKRIDAQTAMVKAGHVWDLDIDLFPPDPRNDTARLLSYGQNLSIPDAAYVLLADRLETKLFTFDRKLIDGVSKLGLGVLATEP